MDGITRRRGRSLPHWSRPDGIYFLTFRTGDAIPTKIADGLKAEYEEDHRKLTLKLGHPPSYSQCQEIRTNRYRRAETYLEEGHGACLLRDGRVAQIVDNAIRFFDEERYVLHAWCLYAEPRPRSSDAVGGTNPNGNHGVLEVIYRKEINKLLGLSGPFWQEEGFDHLVRGPRPFERICRYIWENPRNLIDWPWIGGNGELPVDWTLE